jgi:hypothetical protein
MWYVPWGGRHKSTVAPVRKKMGMGVRGALVRRAILNKFIHTVKDLEDPAVVFARTILKRRLLKGLVYLY